MHFRISPMVSSLAAGSAFDSHIAEQQLQAIRCGQSTGDTAPTNLSVTGGGDTLLALQKRRRYGTALVAMQSFLAVRTRSATALFWFCSCDSWESPDVRLLSWFVYS